MEASVTLNSPADEEAGRSTLVGSNSKPSTLVDGSNSKPSTLVGSSTPSTLVDGSSKPSTLVDGSSTPSTLVDGSSTPWQDKMVGRLWNRIHYGMRCAMHCARHYAMQVGRLALFTMPCRWAG